MRNTHYAAGPPGECRQRRPAAQLCWGFSNSALLTAMGDVDGRGTHCGHRGHVCAAGRGSGALLELEGEQDCSCSYCNTGKESSR